MRLPLCILLSVSIARAAIITADSGSRADVETAQALVSSGDTLVIPAGTNSWTTALTWIVPANVTIRGAGNNSFSGPQTVITINTPDTTGMWNIVNTNGGLRLTGIRFQTETNAVNYQYVVAFTGGPLRVDNCVFAFTNHGYRVGYFNGAFGVTYSNLFLFKGGGSCIFVNNGRLGADDAAGDYEWSLPTEFGSTNYLYIEDNVFAGTPTWNAHDTRVFDGATGAKAVVRFNTLTNCNFGETHSTGHAGDDRGLRSQEIYYNQNFSGTYTLGVDENGMQPGFSPGTLYTGTAMWFGNRYDQAFKTGIRINVTRKNRDTYPQGIYTTSWGYAGPAPIATGTVDLDGTNVTWVSGDNFDTGWPAGSMIHIVGGQDALYGSTDFYIATVPSTTAITIIYNGGHVGAPLSGATFYVGSAWDGNTDSVGYPTLDQPGRGQGDWLRGIFPNKTNSVLGGVTWPRQALEPVYLWDNEGTTVDGWGGSGNGWISDASEGRVVANRDYYITTNGIQTSPTSPFNGTSGMGRGTLANRPTTCTAGVAYWATDVGFWNQSTSNPHGVQQNGADGVLYVATATDTWTLYYTPLTYPHPLRGESVGIVQSRIGGNPNGDRPMVRETGKTVTR